MTGTKKVQISGKNGIVLPLALEVMQVICLDGAETIIM